MGKLTWIKKRVRTYEKFIWAAEDTSHPVKNRRSVIILALEDYSWARPIVTMEAVRAADKELSYSMDIKSVLEKFVGIK